ncbi:MAG: undecaprenyldiphospho-muramoylpentapeptide beta-N-acetylglucosaminyltransferase [Proteobacteria bacterium]|nr:undecaprenyldiphospho-muramoylpentapeptide beta-N-acetylglucosaminyltransferase [Pseudomonadota bacterium]
MSEKFFIVSGGTGGHIIPARCLAANLSSKGHQVFFFGDEKVTSYCQAEDGFKTTVIGASQLKKSFPSLALAALKISVGIVQSLYFLLKFKPKYVVAFGGYATFPMLVASRITKTKILLHEQNSHLGKVNRVFAKFAKKIALSFPATSGIEIGDLVKTSFTGNPVRPEIAALHEISYQIPSNEEILFMPDNRMGYDVLLASDFIQEEKKLNFFKILVLGGSGGAKIFSEILPKSFFNLSDSTKERIQVIQQCRAELVKETFEQYKSYNINIVVDSFFKDIPELLREVHLVIARAGSSSISEFCAAKKPMILIPFAAAADDHQIKNARYLEENGAAIVLKEDDFSINSVNEILKNLLEDESRLKALSKSAGNLAILDATENLARLLND